MHLLDSYWSSVHFKLALTGNVEQWINRAGTYASDSNLLFVTSPPYILIIHKVYDITTSHYEIHSYAFDASY